MKDIVLSGIQGSGKGTQAKLILEHFGEKTKYFEAGGMLRTLQSRPNTVGDYIGSLIDHGVQIPDAFMVKIFELFLLAIKNENNVLLDGFPRKPIETQYFIDLMKEVKRDVIFVVLDIEKDVAINRLTSRYLCKSCGAILNKNLHDITKCNICGSQDIYQRIDDQKIESIETRFARYEELCMPTIKKLEEQGYVRHINGNQAIEKVFEDIIAVIGG